MKKFIFGILSFMLALSGTGLLGSTFASAQDNESVINITSAEQFVSVFALDSTYNENVRVVVDAPLNFSEVDLSSINETKRAFKGTFDGNGNTISNLTFSSSTLYYGLIPYAKDATIKNVRISGTVDFQIDPQNVQEIYAGVLVGYGENVVIENCEIDNTIVDEESGTATYVSVNLPVYSNVNFGFLAGKLKGNPNATSQTQPANIVNCVNYYDVNVAVNKFASIAIGGLVGRGENIYLHNCLNFGKITYSKLETLTSTNPNYQYFGGIAGEVTGSGLYIRNTCFGGEVKSFDDVSGINAFAGAIVGGVSGTTMPTVNVNFDYYTQTGINPSGDGYITAGNKLTNQNIILNKSFLLNGENFDQTIALWDFEHTWNLVNSRYHLQSFQTFEYSFTTILDRNQILESAGFCAHGATAGNASFVAKYGETIDILLTIKNQYCGFYQFSNILLNNNQFLGEYTIEEVENAGVVTGYVISLEANATTAGTYSFVIAQKTYDCVVAISDEAKTKGQGGVYVQNPNIESTPIEEFHMTFAYNSATEQVVAEGYDIYTPDHWELYYKDDAGNFKTEPVAFDQAENNSVSISFGSAPFNQEFKLVAFFTDEEAIKVGFGEYDDTMVKALKINQTDFVDTPFQYASNKVLTIEITTYPDYVLNFQAFETAIAELYGETPSHYPIRAEEAYANELGEMVYTFKLDLNFAKDNIKENSLTLELETLKDTSNDNSNLLWLFITAPIVGVLAIGLIIFFVVRNKRGGKKGGSKKVKEKGYKEYYH